MFFTFEVKAYFSKILFYFSRFHFTRIDTYDKITCMARLILKEIGLSIKC